MMRDICSWINLLGKIKKNVQPPNLIFKNTKESVNILFHQQGYLKTRGDVYFMLKMENKLKINVLIGQPVIFFQRHQTAGLLSISTSFFMFKEA